MPIRRKNPTPSIPMPPRPQPHKVESLQINIEHTKNLGRYENIKIMVGQTVPIPDNGDPVQIRNEIVDELIEFVLEQGKIVAKNNESPYST